MQVKEGDYVLYHGRQVYVATIKGNYFNDECSRAYVLNLITCVLEPHQISVDFGSGINGLIRRNHEYKDWLVINVMCNHIGQGPSRCDPPIMATIFTKFLDKDKLKDVEDILTRMGVSINPHLPTPLPSGVYCDKDGNHVSG